jgi:hypothetical protein
MTDPGPSPESAAAFSGIRDAGEAPFDIDGVRHAATMRANAGGSGCAVLSGRIGAVTARRYWTWIVLLAGSIQLVGMARSYLPAQDGLKFLRVAREFQTQPWEDVVRNSDQHPLYPAVIAFLEPFTALFCGRGPDAWRIAAQLVSALASIALLYPLFHFGRAIFDEATARLTVLLFVLLPVPAVLGHETLSDSLALFGFTTALCLGERAIRVRSLSSALGCGFASGIGFWTRPEVAVLPLAIGITVVVRELVRRWPRTTLRERAGLMQSLGRPAARISVLGVVFLAMVGSYAIFKGQVSEKLALRTSVPVPEKTRLARKVGQWLPRGLDDARWDFSPKEEMERPNRVSAFQGGVRAVGAWAEGLGWLFAPLALLGAWKARGASGRLLVGIYVAVFGAILVRHAMNLGYLSDRHALTLVVATLPWAAAGTLWIGDEIAKRCRWDEGTRTQRFAMASAALVALALMMQAKPVHASRWGHWAAGRWLAAHAQRGDAVLDTRGWATFVSGCNGYDFWHVRQALTDSKLAYVVVGADELNARSRRAATLRALLTYAAEPVAAFPDREHGGGIGVWVYRFSRPASWEGIR